MNDYGEFRSKSFYIPLMILLPSLMKSTALHVIFGTTIRSSSSLVAASQTLMSFLEQVANTLE